jgi:hypothetical protein
MTLDDFRMRTKRRQKRWTNLWCGRTWGAGGYILTVLQHLSLEVVVQLSPASVWVSGVIVHLTSNGIHTHHNTSYIYSII